MKVRPCLWVPVTTAWRVLRLRMEERPPIWRGAATGGACGTYGGKERCAQGFGGET